MSVKSVSEGGVGIPDIKKQMHALKMNWIKKLLCDTYSHKWKDMMLTVHPRLSILYKFGTDVGDFFPSNRFWKDVLSAYMSVGNKVDIESVSDCCSEPLFRNTKLKIGYRTFFYRKWMENNVFLIGHLLNDDGSFLSFESFVEKYGNISNFLIYSGCISAVKKYVISQGIVLDSRNICDHNILYRYIMTSPKGGRFFYDLLLKDDVIPNCVGKWQERLQCEIQWPTVFQKIQKIKEVKLKWLQTRIVHRIIGTNISLQNMGLENSDRCNFCHRYKDNIQHIFWGCHHVQNFWQRFQSELNNKCDTISLTLTENIVLFGWDTHFRSDNVFDLVLLFAKSFVYACRYDKKIPTFELFVQKLKKKYEIEKYIARTKLMYNTFQAQWHTYLPLFE